MHIYSAAQIRAWDAYTIEHEPIASIDLMERASQAFVDWFMNHFPDESGTITILCGIGNNGGDGWAIGRLLAENGYTIQIWDVQIGSKRSTDNHTNAERFVLNAYGSIYRIMDGDAYPLIHAKSVLIDALFGSGLSRPIKGYWAEFIEFINQQDITRLAVDIPSGLFADQLSQGAILQAHHTVSFQVPKRSFFVTEHAKYTGEWRTLDIGLHAGFVEAHPSPFRYVDATIIQSIYRPRPRFGHKGTFGHALLLVGSRGMMGAGILATQAGLSSGCGLVSAHIPAKGELMLQISFPEAVVSLDPVDNHISILPSLSRYQSIGMGCGIGQHPDTANVLKELLQETSVPLVLDADALNILAQHTEWLEHLPANTILTPHPKEFSRLFGPSEHSLDQLEQLRQAAKKYQCVIILKGAFSRIALPDGRIFFNSTGNPGMGTGGSGDVLTGLITGLLAQGYAPGQAAILGVFLHGRAGDLAAEVVGQEALLASDLVDQIGPAYRSLGV
ncbi:MAG: NAD(P)H-hydrate dehydratase [Bacteroidota bacterium]